MPLAALVGYALGEAIAPNQSATRTLIQVIVTVVGGGGLWWHFKRHWTHYVGLD